MEKLIVLIGVFCFFGCTSQKVFKYDSFAAPDFSGTPKRIDSDSSKWILYKIDSGYYNCFQMISYGLEWPSGWSDAVGYFEKRYKKDTYLHFDCHIYDTIPQSVEVSGEDYRHREYYVGGIMLGELVRTEIIDLPFYLYFSPKDSVKVLNDMCHFYEEKPKDCYRIDSKGVKTFYQWVVCENLTSKYFTPQPIK